MQRFGHLKPSFLLTFLLFALMRWDTSLLAQANVNDPSAWQVRADLGDAEIRAMAQDRLGFMWIATTNGLFRFDGVQTQAFRHNPDDTLSLSENFILDLALDPDGQRLWLTTRTGGINVMDTRTGRCRRITRVSDGVASVEISSGNWILVDRQARVWAGCLQGVLEFEPVTHAALLHPFPPAPPDAEGGWHKRLHKMAKAVEDRRNDSLLWIGTGAGLLTFNKRSGAFIAYPYTGEHAYRDQANSIRSLFQTADGRLYYGTFNYGIVCFDPASGVFTSIRLPDQASDANAWNNVIHLLPRTSETLWATTLGGLGIMHVPSQTLSVAALNDLPNKRYAGIRYRDESGRWWHWMQGKLWLHNPLTAQFQQYICPSSLNARGFIVHKIGVDDASGKLLIVAHSGNGLYLLDRNTGIWSVAPSASVQEAGAFIGWDLLRTSRGEWLVLEQDAVYRLSDDRAILQRYRHQPPLTGAYYRSFAEDRQGNLWIGSYYKGLARLNLSDGSCRVYKQELEAAGMPGSSLACWHVLADELDQIWVRRTNGYSVYHPKSDTFDHLFPFGKNEKAHVERLERDAAGRIWVLGEEFGLGLADPMQPGQGLTRHLTYEHPLKSLKVHRLAFDRKGRAWIGSSAGLECLTDDLGASDVFPAAYGIQEPIECMTTLPSGEIALGGRSAVRIFHPDSLAHNTEMPVPYLTSFQVFQRELAADTLLPYRHTVTLAHDQNYFSIEFSAIGFNLPEHQMFEYRLEGVDPDWVDPGARRYVSYTNLGSGDYIFSLRVANNEGVWCARPLRLHIHIATPWWNTVWAWALYLLLAGGGSYGFYRYQLRRRLEQAETRRLLELDALKTRLYTNITHEFRTPLTVIEGMAEQLRADPDRWREEGPEIIRRNSRSLLQLVNQMLELRKLEAGMLPVHLEQGDAVAFVRYLLESFHSLAAAKQVDLVMESAWEHFQMDFDAEKLQTIVSNLVGNAVKFTPAGGRVGLKIAPAADDPSRLELCVQDTGIGIPADELPRIFDRFHQVAGTTGGSGIGLTLVKELVQLLGGNIRAASAPGQGACFTVQLPVTRRAMPRRTGWGFADRHATTPPAGAPLSDTVPEAAPLLQIVEDNPDVALYLSACLEPDYRLIRAENGPAALEQAFEQIPDLVVSDVMMPGMDGFELCRMLKSDIRTDHIPIVLLTARADIDARLQGLQHGADAYLVKPFHREELLLQIQNLLESRRALQAHYRTPVTGAMPAETPQEHPFVLKARAIVEARLTDPAFDVAQFCRAVGMSNSNLHRKLTALTGRSANQFIRHIRLAKACVLLRDPEPTIAAVAYDCGFSDPVYFARVFRQEYGVTPSEWRAKP